MHHREKQQIKRNLWTLAKVGAWLFIAGIGIVLGLILIGAILAISGA